MEQKRAVGYARSAAKNDDHIERQVEAINTYCHTRQWPIEEVYIDNGDPSHPGRKKMLRDIGTGKYDVIVVTSLDRLSRSVAEVSQLIGTIARAGCDVLTVDGSR